MRLALVSKLSKIFRYKSSTFKHGGRRHNSTGLFGVAALNSSSGFDCLEQDVYKQCENVLKEAFSPSRNRKMVEIVDDVSNSICKLADLAECMRNLHPDPKFVLAAEECMARLSGFVERLNTDVTLYNAVKKASDEGDEMDRRVSQLFLSDFESSGVHLPQSKRQSFVNISEAIFRTGSEFARGCENPVVIATPQSKKSFTLFGAVQNKENQIEYLDHCGAYIPDAQQREKLYKLYYSTSESQEAHLDKLIDLRHALAKTSGFETFAHRALKDSILDKPNIVDDFLTHIIQKLKPQAETDLEELCKLMPKNQSINVWDLPYLKSMRRRKLLMHLAPKLANQFDIESTLNGVRKVVENLYGITLKRVQPESGEIWHEDVEKLQVYDKTDNFRGTIYCDWFDRDGKISADSHFTVRCGKTLNLDQYQAPMVVLTFRFSKANLSDYFGPTELTNILHEFGHAMHSMLGLTKYQHVAGTRCPTDFSEIPSNLMEMFMLDSRTFNLFNKNPNLAKNDVDCVVEALKSCQSIDCLQQAVYALFDLRLHSNQCQNLSTSQFFDAIAEKTWPMMTVDGTCWHHRFSHLVPYGAKYHAYLVARAAASLIWRQLFVEDPLSRRTGQRWAQVQSCGGEIHPKTLLLQVIGHNVTPDLLCDALLEK